VIKSTLFDVLNLFCEGQLRCNPGVLLRQFASYSYSTQPMTSAAAAAAAVAARYHVYLVFKILQTVVFDSGEL
jgi:hypothetical protein